VSVAATVSGVPACVVRTTLWSSTTRRRSSPDLALPHYSQLTSNTTTILNVLPILLFVHTTGFFDCTHHLLSFGTGIVRGLIGIDEIPCKAILPVLSLFENLRMLTFFFAVGHWIRAFLGRGMPEQSTYDLSDPERDTARIRRLSISSISFSDH
jgi:hypothetical protein